MAAAPVPVVLYQVHIDFQVVGPQHGHAPRQLLAGTVARRHRPFLILGAQVVVIEGVVTDRLDPGGSLPYGGQPDSREARLANRVGLTRKVIPPPVSTLISVGRARNPFVARPEKGLQKNAHDRSPFPDYRRQLRYPAGVPRDYSPYPPECICLPGIAKIVLLSCLSAGPLLRRLLDDDRLWIKCRDVRSPGTGRWRGGGKLRGWPQRHCPRTPPLRSR